MKRLIVKNIGLLTGIGHEEKLCLKGKEMAEFNTLSDAYLVIENGRFADYGKMNDCPLTSDNEEVVDANGGATPILILFMQEAESKSLLTRFVGLVMLR